jgi:hypothetical protein
MGYRRTSNLYKDTRVLSFKQVFCLEKIHGTTSWIQWSNGNLSFYSGGETHANFVALFDQDKLTQYFSSKYTDADFIRVHGEAYGGKQQGMSKTYGPKLHFTAFEVNINGVWLDVPNAENYVKNLGLEFVPYELVDATEENINRERDRDSIIAIWRGMGAGHIREGIVIRPPFEVVMNDGERCMAKHKRDEFREHKSSRSIVEDPEKRAVLEAAEAVADEWCVPMRLQHVLGHLTKDDVEPTMSQMGDIIKAMIEDIYVEAGDEIKQSRDVEKAIGTKTVKLFTQYLRQRAGLSGG